MARDRAGAGRRSPCRAGSAEALRAGGSAADCRTGSDRAGSWGDPDGPTGCASTRAQSSTGSAAGTAPSGPASDRDGTAWVGGTGGGPGANLGASACGRPWGVALVHGPGPRSGRGSGPTRVAPARVAPVWGTAFWGTAFWGPAFWRPAFCGPAFWGRPP